MSKAKAAGKIEPAARRSATSTKVATARSTSEAEETAFIKDIPQLRQSIHDVIRRSAEEIAAKVIQDAKEGQLAAAKYLFELIGLYPQMEQPTERPIEKTLAHTLLTRMGLPIEPLDRDEDGPFVKETTLKSALPGGDAVE